MRKAANPTIVVYPGYANHTGMVVFGHVMRRSRMVRRAVVMRLHVTMKMDRVGTRTQIIREPQVGSRV